MIKLFELDSQNINTNYDNILHGSIVERFESEFRDYVGAKYSCSLNSATSAIFLTFLNKNITVTLPSILPPVVANAILNSGNKINFNDIVDWVGNSYLLYQFKDYQVWDSAQRVDRNQFKNIANPQDLMIFSFYPTKPIGSCDGGIIVSDDYEKIRWFKEASLNGMTFSENNWERTIKFPGWKMYMNSIQAEIALTNLRTLDKRKERLKEIRECYNNSLRYFNTSDHLYRIYTHNNEDALEELKTKNITTGIHYKALHLNKIYNLIYKKLEESERITYQTLSIPFHHKLKDEEVKYVIEKVIELY